MRFAQTVDQLLEHGHDGEIAPHGQRQNNEIGARGPRGGRREQTLGFDANSLAFAGMDRRLCRRFTLIFDLLTCSRATGLFAEAHLLGLKFVRIFLVT